MFKNNTKIPPQELIRKWKIRRGILTNNLVVIRLIAIYVLPDGNTDNGEQQIRK